MRKITLAAFAAPLTLSIAACGGGSVQEVEAEFAVGDSESTASVSEDESVAQNSPTLSEAAAREIVLAEMELGLGREISEETLKEQGW